MLLPDELDGVLVTAVRSFRRFLYSNSDTFRFTGGVDGGVQVTPDRSDSDAIKGDVATEDGKLEEVLVTLVTGELLAAAPTEERLLIRPFAELTRTLSGPAATSKDVGSIVLLTSGARPAGLLDTSAICWEPTDWVMVDREFGLHVTLDDENVTTGLLVMLPEEELDIKLLVLITEVSSTSTFLFTSSHSEFELESGTTTFALDLDRTFVDELMTGEGDSAPLKLLIGDGILLLLSPVLGCLGLAGISLLGDVNDVYSPDSLNFTLSSANGL